MSLPKVVIKSKALKISGLHRDFLFSFLMLLFLTSLLAYQSAFALSSSFKEYSIEEVGYAHQQRHSNFSHAQMAFENQDYAYSAKLLGELAEMGHTEAQYLLATQYDTGLGVKRNTASSFYWYKQAARAGVSIAQHNLAVAYAQGSGIQQDVSKAITWWKRAANKGHTDSQFNLGIIYATGNGLRKPDMKQALKWWRMAANNGDAAAQFNLGALYANGLGSTSVRKCEAMHWLQRSQENGFEQAQNALAHMKGSVDLSTCK